MAALKKFYAILALVIAVSFMTVTVAPDISCAVTKGHISKKNSPKHNNRLSKAKRTEHLKSGKRTGTKKALSRKKVYRNKSVFHNSKKRALRHSTSGRAKTAAFTRIAELKELSMSEDVLTDLGKKERLVLFAKKMMHLPYQFGGNGLIGLDCSAYVQKAFNFVGLGIPRSAREQFSFGEDVEREKLETGDLVFFHTYASFPSHVGIYLGNNLFIHASSRSGGVTINSLEAPYYVSRFAGAKRVIFDN